MRGGPKMHAPYSRYSPRLNGPPSGRDGTGDAPHVSPYPGARAGLFFFMSGWHIFHNTQLLARLTLFTATVSPSRLP